MFVANCGDSRAVLQKGSTAVRLSYDHSVKDEQERKRVTQAGGIFLFDKLGGSLNLTRSFGNKELWSQALISGFLFVLIFFLAQNKNHQTNSLPKKMTKQKKNHQK